MLEQKLELNQRIQGELFKKIGLGVRTKVLKALEHISGTSLSSSEQNEALIVCEGVLSEFSAEWAMRQQTGYEMPDDLQIYKSVYGIELKRHKAYDSTLSLRLRHVFYLMTRGHNGELTASSAIFDSGIERAKDNIPEYSAMFFDTTVNMLMLKVIRNILSDQDYLRFLSDRLYSLVPDLVADSGFLLPETEFIFTQLLAPTLKEKIDGLESMGDMSILYYDDEPDTNIKIGIGISRILSDGNLPTFAEMHVAKIPVIKNTQSGLMIGEYKNVTRYDSNVSGAVDVTHKEETQPGTMFDIKFLELALALVSAERGIKSATRSRVTPPILYATGENILDLTSRSPVATGRNLI